MDYDIVLKRLRKRPRVNGWTSPNTETKNSRIHGLGLFALSRIDVGEPVAAWGGHIVRSEELALLPPHLARHYALPIHPGFFLSEITEDELDAADFINHSCDPNCTIVDELILVAKREVLCGEELTADFEEDNGTTIIDCACGMPCCRGIVRL